MVKAVLTKSGPCYIITTEQGIVVNLGSRYPSLERQRHACRPAIGEEVVIDDRTPPRGEPVPRNRTRAQRVASGRVSVEVSLTVEQRDAIDADAERLGLSRNARVAKWADSLVKRHGQKKRQARSKSSCVPVRRGPCSIHANDELHAGKRRVNDRAHDARAAKQPGRPGRVRWNDRHRSQRMDQLES